MSESDKGAQSPNRISTVKARPQLGVIGEGTVGLQTGIEALKKGFDVNIYEYSRHSPALATEPERQRVSTASETGVAQWLPFVEGGITNEEQEEQVKWIRDSFEWYTNERVTQSYKEAMTRRRNVELMKDTQPMPDYLKSLLRELGPVEEFDAPANPTEYKYGWDFTTLAFNSPAMLQKLEAEFKELGGNIITRHIANKDQLYELPEAFVANCMGLQARAIFPDLELKAMKGHLMFLDNPGIDKIVSADDIIMLPRSSNRLVIGSLFIHEGDYDTMAPTRDERDEIWARMNGLLNIDIDFFRDLKGKISENLVVGETAGLRPYREKGTMVAAEAGPNGKIVVHNVGHGGMGWTISPGTAKAAVRLLEQAI